MDKDDEEGYQEITLEAWREDRDVHRRLMDYGSLFKLNIEWGPGVISLNVIALKEGVVCRSQMPTVLETGEDPAFVVPKLAVDNYRLHGLIDYLVSHQRALSQLLFLQRSEHRGLL